MSKKKRKLKRANENPFSKVIHSLVVYLKETPTLSLSRVESILYDNVIVERIQPLNLMFTSGQSIDELCKFMTSIEPIRGVRAITWLFKDRLTQQLSTGDKRQKYQVGDWMVNIIKEIVWVTYYIANKARSEIRLFGSPFECLNRILGIELNTSESPDAFGLDRNKFIANILSLKDARYDLLPYPDHICPVDLETLLIDNGLNKNLPLLWIVKSLRKEEYRYAPYEHYHVFKFVRNLVIEALHERSISNAVL